MFGVGYIKEMNDRAAAMDAYASGNYALTDHNPPTSDEEPSPVMVLDYRATDEDEASHMVFWSTKDDPEVDVTDHLHETAAHDWSAVVCLER